ncbi:hypothetical protein [Sphingomonas turrisvirgatae]|uniref:Uncharacterized protein n=1 Tax=Sphingomonas turrisvirgatae TaxID=1888892 RepID=A0A1E3LQM6_9SPHN|nr:hypothetical protein [Sphingomonas turrisvirgatae]ODP36069.1 hypothetical protein BFL28_08280 [Sphingomonas turrisvirgatae]
MNGRGRPLRFVALVAAGWAGARVLILWPDGGDLPAAIEEAFPIQGAVAAEPAVVASAKRAAPSLFVPLAVALPAVARPAWPPPQRADRGEPAAEAAELVALERPEVLGAPVGALPGLVLPSGPSASVQLPSRWSASGWFVTGRGAPAGGPLLGGDQAGLRVAYALDESQRLRAYLRATAPLASAAREVALGVEWQPSDLPLRVVAEQRVGLDGNAGGPAIGVVGGVDAIELPIEFELSAYGQAGIVWRGRADPFADGAVRVTREVAGIGPARVALGGGVWGAAQRDATRLDLGPSAVATLPLGGRAVKLSIDWRERVAGNARPGSGPAVTLGADF